MRNSPEIRLTAVAIGTEYGGEVDDATDDMRRAYDLCAREWGPDERWTSMETRLDSRYFVYQYDTIVEPVVEIRDDLQPEMGTLEVAASRFADPRFRLGDVYSASANTDPICVWEGGWYRWLRDRYGRNKRTHPRYEPYQWTAIKNLRDVLDSERQRMNIPKNTVKVWPALDGYCVHLEGTDIFYTIKHAEVLGDAFNPGRVLDQMLTMRDVPFEDRPQIFQDTTLNRRQGIMMNAAKLMVGASRAQRNAKKTEGVNVPLERTSMQLKDQSRKIPEPIVVLAKINGHQIRALLDTGSMADFLSTTVVDQLNLQSERYAKPLPVQLAVHGSRSKINCGVKVTLQYQKIDCERRFDVANLDNYDAILGTPFLFQHKVAIGLNPPCIVVGSTEPVKIEGPDVVTIKSAGASLLEDELTKLRSQLKKEAEDLCADPSKTTLPPFRAVNHTIPLMDKRKVYRFRRSTCPEAFKEQWWQKKETYIATGRWRVATRHNAIPLLMIPKVSLSGGKPGLRKVFNKREQNANTFKLASPLPDIEEILREVSRHKF